MVRAAKNGEIRCNFRRRNYDILILKKDDKVLFPHRTSYKQSFLIKGKTLRWNLKVWCKGQTHFNVLIKKTKLKSNDSGSLTVLNKQLQTMWTVNSFQWT